MPPAIRTAVERAAQWRRTLAAHLDVHRVEEHERVVPWR
jgi:hypothetical protein